MLQPQALKISSRLGKVVWRRKTCRGGICARSWSQTWRVQPEEYLKKNLPLKVVVECNSFVPFVTRPFPHWHSWTSIRSSICKSKFHNVWICIYPDKHSTGASPVKNAMKCLTWNGSMKSTEQANMETNWKQVNVLSALRHSLKELCSWLTCKLSTRRGESPIALKILHFNHPLSGEPSNALYAPLTSTRSTTCSLISVLGIQMKR